MPKKGEKQSKEKREALSRTMKLKYLEDPGYRERVREGTKAAMARPEVRKRMMDGLLEVSATPERRQQLREMANRLYEERPEIKDQISTTLKEKYADGEIQHWSEDPEFSKQVGERISLGLVASKEVRSEKTRENWKDPEFRQKTSASISEAQLAHYQDPEYAAKHKAASRKPEVRERVSKGQKAYWRDSEPEVIERHLENLLASQKRKPTKPEIFLSELFRLKGVQMEYVGDGKFWIRNHNPDFVNKEKKVVLEYDGSLYWHKDRERDKRRDDVYKKHGWRVISIRTDQFSEYAEEIVKEVLKFLKSKVKSIILAIRGPRLVRVKE